MATNGVEIEGIDILLKRLGSLEDQGVKAESAALRAGGDIIAEAVKEEAPVKSETLKNSVKRSGVRDGEGGKYVLITPKAFYAHMVEFGTSKKRANPFVARGYESSKARALAVMAQEVRRHLGL